MQIQEQKLGASAQLDPQSLWHFRALPDKVQECTVRRLALSGLPDYEIAARTGWPIDRVRQLRLQPIVPLGDALRFARASGQHYDNLSPQRTSMAAPDVLSG